MEPPTNTDGHRLGSPNPKSVPVSVRRRPKAGSGWVLAFLLSLAAVMARGQDVVCDADSDCYYVPSWAPESGMPVLFVLSCTGATEADLDSNRVVAESLGWLLVSCHGARNHRSAGDNDRDIMNTYARLVRDYAIDPARVFIGGFSGMGAQALQELVYRPDLFRGAFAACAPYRGPAPVDNASFSGRAAYLVTRSEDWNRVGNQAQERWLSSLGMAVQLVTTEGKHEVGGPAELLAGCVWLEEQTK